jgi:hypothetical protein
VLRVDAFGFLAPGSVSSASDLRAVMRVLMTQIGLNQRHQFCVLLLV